ncbi:MAG: SDR family oxidoreductase [Gemmatimonadota bacterium]
MLAYDQSRCILWTRCLPASSHRGTDLTPDDLAVRSFLVTGANSGIGRALVEALAARKARLVLACRSEERAAPVLEALRARDPGVEARVLAIDLADLGSVRSAAASFLATGDRLDVLVNNAGIAGTHALSADGFDLTYATNHIGPFLLTNLLLPRLLESAEGRVVNVASAAHRHTDHIDWTVLARRDTARRSAMADYAVTKLMNILHARELARRLVGTRVATYSLHPGAVASNIWRKVPQPLQGFIKLFMLSSDHGARTPLYCATAPELRGVSGRYYAHDAELAPSPLAQNDALAHELWEQTEQILT